MTDLTHEAFAAFVRMHRLAVVHFWAAWNGQDLVMKQFLEQRVPDELRNQIAFGRFDVDPPAHWEICRQHRVMNVPFLVFYREGAVAGTLTGVRDDAVVIGHLRQLTGEEEAT